jgi:hypothetical protein
MKAKVFSGVVLQQVASTALYQPQQTEPGENLLFLRWEANKPPALIPLEDTWAESGTPPIVGYFLFLNVLPAVSDAPAFEQQMRKTLPNPGASAFAWVTYAPQSKKTNVQTLLKTKLNTSKNPCIDGDTQLVLLPGQQSVGFSDGALVFAIYEDGFVSGFVVTYPPLSGANTPGKLAVSLPMNGNLVGCVAFEGLTNAIGAPSGNVSALKTLVRVAIDPLHPLDPKRNYQQFTGEDFTLTQDGNTYFISRAS